MRRHLKKNPAGPRKERSGAKTRKESPRSARRGVRLGLSAALLQATLNGNVMRGRTEGDFLEGLHNLKDRICAFDNLMGAYRDASKNKRYRSEVLSFSFNLGENLRQIQRELLEMTYAVGPYREFYVRYPKPRLVMALGFRDRIVQWAIYRQINPYLDKRYIEHSYGCRKDKGTLAAAECLQGWQRLISRKPEAGDWYLVKGDISKYFYRVDHEKVIHTYSEVSQDPWFGWLMSIIINNPDVPFGLPPGVKPDDCPRNERLYEVGMPIGNLTSQETANLYLDSLDQFCKHVLKLHFYVRYMDDFCFYIKGKENARAAFEAISLFLREELLLEISPKSHIQRATDPVEFVGYLLTPQGIRLRKKTVAHVKRSLRFMMAAYASGAVSYEKAVASGVCYMGMCCKCSGYHLLRWIEENYVLERIEEPMHETSGPPGGRRFYSILKNESGTVDVYLRGPENPDGTALLPAGCDTVLYAVRGVVPFDGLEEDIRAHYDAWCESAEPVCL